MYSDILCVGLERPLIIGRPTNFVDAGGFLCIFGSRYHFGVRTFVFKGSRYLNMSLSICLFTSLIILIGLMSAQNECSVAAPFLGFCCLLYRGRENSIQIHFDYILLYLNRNMYLNGKKDLLRL